MEGQNTLCYVLLLPNERQLCIYINIYAHLNTRGILTPLRRPVKEPQYLAVMDCGRVPINNLDSVIRVRQSLVIQICWPRFASPFYVSLFLRLIVSELSYADRISSSHYYFKRNETIYPINLRYSPIIAKSAVGIMDKEAKNNSSKAKFLLCTLLSRVCTRP